MDKTVFLKVFNDGTIMPELQHGSPVLVVSDGQASLGRYNKDQTKAGKQLILDELPLTEELRFQIRLFLRQEYPDVFYKKHIVYLLCPRTIQTLL